MEVSKTTQSTTAHLRKEFLRENDIQFILDKAYRYGWADSYAFSDNDHVIGYGSVWGRDKREDRDAIFEFYLRKEYRQLAEQFFAALCSISKASYIECQTNDRFLYPMFQKFAHNIQTESILFADQRQTNLIQENVNIIALPQSNPDDCQYLLMKDNEEIGEGGFMLNYNFPYADVYYSIRENHRRKGYGSFFVQELKREIYKIGRVPAARCAASNEMSKATLLKSGMVVCGLRVMGEVVDAGSWELGAGRVE